MAPNRHVSARTRRRRRRQLRSLAQLTVIVAAVVLVGRLDHRSSSAAGVATRGDGAPTTTSRPRGATTTMPEAPTTVAPADPARLLSSPAVSRYLSGRKGSITAAVYDVTTKATSLLHPELTEQTASIEKVDILATLLEDYQERGPGTAVSSKDASLAADMIEHSDNDAAQDLWRELGQQDGVALFNRRVGMAGTILGAGGLWGVTTTTAADQLKLMMAVVLPGPLLDAASQSFELGLMERVESDQAWGISAGVPSGTTLALKNGWVSIVDGNWQVNSIGWVDGGGRNYIVVVLTNGNPTEDYGIDTIEALSSLVWTGLAA